MIIKAIIFDVDEVLIQVPHYFTQELQNRGYKNAVKIMNEYYGDDNTLCAEWKGEAVELIVPYLERIWWEQWVEEYFKQQFMFEKQYLDTNLVSLIPKIQALWIKCYLWTDQEENRAQFLLEWLNFKNIMDWYFISCYVWVRKCLPEFWYHIKKTLLDEWIGKEEIVFFDDLQCNVDVANGEGIKAFLFTDMENFQKDLKKLGIKV